MMQQKIPLDNLDVHFSNAKKINAVFGIKFNPTRFYDPRVLGYASTGKIIGIETMMPEKRAALTLIHEWTHIWQYKNLDYKRMNKEYDKYLVEGHTTWAEIHYAKQKWNEDWEEKLAPETRRDEYGDGYRLIVKLLKETGFEDPFKYLLKYYPKK